MTAAPGVRMRLVSFVIGCVLPIAVVAACMIVNVYDNDKRQLIDNTRSQVRAITSALDREFDSTRVALMALATSRMLANDDLAGFHARARDVLANMRADSIVLVGLDGALLMSTRRPFGQPLPKLSATPLLKRIVQSGRPGVSDLFMGPLAGTYIYSVGVPILRDGKVVMTLNATATHTQLARVLREHHLPPNWRASIVDRNGKVAVRSHDIQKFLGQSIPPALKQHIAAVREDGAESRTLDGIDVFTMYSRSPMSEWTAIVGIPLDELTAPLQRTLAWLIAATLAALGVGLALAWRIGGQIADSVQVLATMAGALGRHACAAIPPLYFKEANELGKALLDASRDLDSAQALHRESEQRLALAADATGLGIWVRDLDQDALWASEHWRGLFGFAPAARIGMADFAHRIHADDRAAMLERIANALQSGHGYDIEYRIVLPDGQLRWIGSKGSVESDAAGQPRRVRGVSMDITKRKQAELDVQQKQREVTHLARVAVMGELSGAMAHELNQPLTAILTNAQAAIRYLRKEQPNLDEVRAILADIVSEDERAGAIIERLRGLFDKTEAARVRVDIDALVSGVNHILRNDLINHGVRVRTELAAAGAAVIADRVQLQQVLINLLINGCDAMSAPGGGGGVLVLASALADDGMVELSVRDAGCGIAPAAMARIFDPFYTTKERGMGLGLSICRNIIVAHGGQLWADNNADGGATFRLRLPLAGPAP